MCVQRGHTQVPLWALGSTRLGEEPQCWSLSPTDGPGGQRGAAVPVWQESPVQPGGQAHRPGKAQRPPFWHGTWQRAARAIRHSVTWQGWGGSRAPSPATTGVCARTTHVHRAARPCTSPSRGAALASAGSTRVCGTQLECDEQSLDLQPGKRPRCLQPAQGQGRRATLQPQQLRQHHAWDVAGAELRALLGAD